MNFTRTAAALAAAALLVTACGGGDDDGATETSTTTTVAATTTTTEATTTTAGPSTTQITIAPTTTLPPILRQPLTGEPLDSEADLIERPALGVKIDNHPDARRNHTGLAVADIVYEEKVEGGLTRFAAVFHSRGADPVGPIRSGRSQDVALLSSMNSPLFAWSGGNPGVTALIRDSLLTDLNYQLNTGAYYRGPGRSPHNVYSSTDELYSLTPVDHPGPPVEQFAYLRPGQAFSGAPATTIEMRIGDVFIDWDWNADEGRYERSQAGSEHEDKTYGRVGADNVVVLAVEYRPSQIDRNSPEAQTVGGGPAFVFSNGQVVEGRWSRELAIYPIELTDPSGAPLALAPGQTWVELAEAMPSDDAENPDVSLSFS